MDTDRLSDTFIDLADTMVAEFDIIDFLHMLTDRSVRLLAASAAGVMLAHPRGELRVAAASSEQAGLPDLFQLQNDQAPAGIASAPADPSRPLTSPAPPGDGPGSPRLPRSPGSGRWRPCRYGCGIRSSGRLTCSAPSWTSSALRTCASGQALADVATIGLLHHWNVPQRNRRRAALGRPEQPDHDRAGQRQAR
jgi:hypothetical protein